MLDTKQQSASFYYWPSYLARCSCQQEAIVTPAICTILFTKTIAIVMRCVLTNIQNYGLLYLHDNTRYFMLRLLHTCPW